MRARGRQTLLPAWEFILGFSRRSAWRWAALAWYACRLLDSCASCARLCGRMLELLACARSREVCFACVRRTHAWVHIARGGNGDLSTCVPPNMPGGARRWPRWHVWVGMTELLPRVRRGRALACVGARLRRLRVRALALRVSRARVGRMRGCISQGSGDMRWFTSPRSGTSERYTTATENLH